MRKLGKVVSNSSPIIGLSILNLVNILWELFDEVIITEAVFEEVVTNGKGNRGYLEVVEAIQNGNITVYKVRDEFFVKKFFGKLHKGELEVIAAAKELDASYLLIDDKAARVLAETLLLEPTGLIGILKIAKITGKINNLKICLDKLILEGFRISKKLYSQLLKEVNELSEDK
jgi:predicted nucleic acid-binding protein